MKCKLCDDFYLIETDIFNLFEFPEICPDCYKKYFPKIEYEVIPYSYGEAYYLYLYSDLNFNIKQKTYLSKHLRIIYLNVMNNNLDVYPVVHIDDDMLDDLKTNLTFLKSFEKIIFFSLIRVNFDGFMIFF